jgi:hypothetical protein
MDAVKKLKIGSNHSLGTGHSMSHGKITNQKQQSCIILQAIYSIWGPQFMDELYQGELFDLGTPNWWINYSRVQGELFYLGDELFQGL